MATKNQVIQLNADHPDWTARRIAEELECGQAYVIKTAARQNLKLAKRPRKEPAPHKTILALGRAAFLAGVTLADIELLSRERKY